MRAEFRTHLYPDRSRRSGQRSSRANAAAKSALARVRQQAKSEGRLEFHPPSANKYYGVPSQVKFHAFFQPPVRQRTQRAYHRIRPARLFFRRRRGLFEKAGGRSGGDRPRRSALYGG